MSNITITRHGTVLQLEFARPEKKNALIGAMYDTLRHALHEADASTDINVIVISGAGGTFTAGNDIGDFLGHRGDMAANPASRFIKALAAGQTPIIAAVQGQAIGIGTTLLLHCDMVFAAPDATFKMPFTDLGLVPEAGASLIVPARFGIAKATEWLMLGNTFGAEEAFESGLVNAIVPHEDLITHALGMAQRLAAKPRSALRATRALMRPNQAALQSHIDLELQTFAAALASPEAKAAFMAFMTKKK